MASNLVGAKIGKYSIIRQLGKGGMGEVYQARHEMLGRDVAVKVLSKALGDDEEAIQRFRREAKAVNLIQHDSIVQVTDFDEIEDGRGYYVMELLEGKNLAEYLNEKRRLSLQETFSILTPVMEALAAAHDANIIHRDIKPENIFLHQGKGKKAEPRLLDFGVAKLADPDCSGVATKTGTLLGTPRYMPPEQAEGENKDIGPQSDVYSVAAVMFHMLAGRPPYTGKTFGRLLLQHMQDPPPSLRAVVPDAPPELDAMIRRAMAKKPAERHNSMRELLDNFNAVIHGLPFHVPSRSDDQQGPAGSGFDTSAEGLSETSTAATSPGNSPSPARNIGISSVSGAAAQTIRPDETRSGRTREHSRKTLILGGVIAALVATSAYLWFSNRKKEAAENRKLQLSGDSGRHGKVPSLLGLSLDNARRTTRPLRLQLRVVGRRTDSTFPSDTICVQVPSKGTNLPDDGIVKVILSKGNPMSPVPPDAGAAAKEETKGSLVPIQEAMRARDWKKAIDEANIFLADNPDSAMAMELKKKAIAENNNKNRYQKFINAWRRRKTATAVKLIANFPKNSVYYEGLKELRSTVLHWYITEKYVEATRLFALNKCKALTRLTQRMGGILPHDRRFRYLSYRCGKYTRSNGSETDTHQRTRPAKTRRPAATTGSELEDQTRIAYVNNKCRSTIRLGKKAYQANKSIRVALLVGICACRMKRGSTAEWAYRRLPEGLKGLLERTCKAQGISIGKHGPVPPEKPRKPSRPSEPISKPLPSPGLRRISISGASPGSVRGFEIGSWWEMTMPAGTSALSQQQQSMNDG